MTEDNPRRQLLRRFYYDRPLAHEVLFAHRRPHLTPPFHRELIDDWHSSHPRILDLVFRGGAKSTIAEEAVCIQAGFREFKNAVFVGATKPRAQERLHAVRHEIETNEKFQRLFGDLVGPVWSDDELVFANGRRIIALGRGQALRGTKFEDLRPDLIFGDDLEDREEVWTKTGRNKAFYWFIRDLLPAGDLPTLKVRVAATPLDPEAIPMRLKRDPEWKTHVYPIMYKDLETGELVSSWPSRYPMKEILRLRESFRRAGDMSGFNAEYMCLAESPETKVFKADMVFVEPRVKTWQAVYTMEDPARTIGAKSAATGHAEWSWIGGKLVVWDCWARHLMPNQIVESMFETWQRQHPVWMGFEEDGLNLWGLQPIRQAMIDRGVTLPLRAVKAPRGKIEFIRGLQPFFIGREVILAKDMPDLKDELLSFPTGEIDGLNALAYALKMKPGAPIYDNFRGSHVAEDIAPLASKPLWLCLNATHSSLVGVVLQAFDGSVRVFHDAVREGDPVRLLADLVADVQADFGRTVRLKAGPRHFDQHHNFGLVAAARRLPKEIEGAAMPSEGRAWIIRALNAERSGFPVVMVDSRASWTLNAFAGGYARVLEKNGVLSDQPEENEYRVVMEAIESFCGLFELGLDELGGRGRFNAHDAHGRPYRSIIPGAYAPTPTKDAWTADG